jgi:hypothetical protein
MIYIIEKACRMSKLRKYAFLSLFVLSALTISISFYLYAKSETISNPKWSEYEQFVNIHGRSTGGEVHFSEENGKIANRLLFEACESKEAMTIKICADWSFLGFGISGLFFLAGLFILAYNVLRKSFRCMFNNPQKSILSSAVLFFIASWLFPPFIHSGQIYYSFLLMPIWNGSRIFWALMLVEWTIVLLPLGLIYKHLYGKDKNTSNAVTAK